MYKYRITLTSGSTLIATSDFSVIYTAYKELTEGKGLFLHIGNVIVRIFDVKSIEEIEIESIEKMEAKKRGEIR